MPAKSSGVCKSCGEGTQKSFSSEVAIHFPGLDGLKKPIVWVFPKCSVCLSCGFTEFVVPERELRVLVEGKQEAESSLVFYRKPEANTAQAA